MAPAPDERPADKRSAAHLSEAADSTRDVAQEDFLFHLYRGSELLQENRVLEAKEELEFALTMQPSDPKGQDLLGAVYFRLGLYPRAIQIYESLTLQFSRDVSIKINLALCYLKTGQPEPAKRTLQDAVRLNPEHKRAWGYLGLALQKLGELEPAQIAFERGGQALMAKRIVERRQRATAPAPPDGSPEIDEGVRVVAETAFSELDAGELRFALAEPGPPQTGPWHTLELGDAAGRPRSPYAKTLPPPSARDAHHVAYDAATIAPQSAAEPVHQVLAAGLASTRVAPPAREVVLAETPTRTSNLPDETTLVGAASIGATSLGAVPIGAAAALEAAGQGQGHATIRALVPAPVSPAQAQSLLGLPADVPLALHPTGMLLVRATDEQAFAARLEALRVVAGAATSRVLHRRSRDADTSEVLGGLGSPLVRVAGAAELVIGPRPNYEVVVLALEDGLAFVREDLLLGFELRLAYENGRLATEPIGESIRAGASVDGTSIVQLRGHGRVALELARKLARLPCSTGRPLLVRREWIVGWLGRLVPRALPPAESPSGQRGLVGFSGDGTVLVCPG
jgi:Flp pilus assembly protein TadD